MLASADQSGLEPLGPWAVVIILAELITFAWIMTQAIIKASNLPAPAMVTTALAVLTLIAIGGLILTRDQVLGAVAATGIGALAGAMTNLFNQSHKDDKKNPDGDEGET